MKKYTRRKPKITTREWHIIIRRACYAGYMAGKIKKDINLLITIYRVQQILRLDRNLIVEKNKIFSTRKIYYKKQLEFSCHYCSMRICWD